MANFQGAGRSNYFKVNDLEGFKNLCELMECKVYERDSKVAFASNTEDGSPNSYFSFNETFRPPS